MGRKMMQWKSKFTAVESISSHYFLIQGYVNVYYIEPIKQKKFPYFILNSLNKM